MERHLINEAIEIERKNKIKGDDSEDAQAGWTQDVATLVNTDSLSQQIELQLGLLTQGVSECMILATGAAPNLTEGPEPEARPSYSHVRTPTSRPVSWSTARSLQLRDAARLAQSSAGLISGYAKLRGQFAQRFTVRHTDSRDGGKNSRRVTTITQSFAVPRGEAMPQGLAIPGAEIDRTGRPQKTQ